MLRLGKLSQQAIAAATCLAERYDDGEVPRVSAAEIADARELPRPVVSKVMAALAQGGIVEGAPGPTGGYRLAREPEAVSLHDIVEVFERTDVKPMCPFGPYWCETGDLCPLHDAIAEAAEQVSAFLQSHDLGAFRGGGRGAKAPKAKGKSKVKAKGKSKPGPGSGSRSKPNPKRGLKR